MTARLHYLCVFTIFAREITDGTEWYGLCPLVIQLGLNGKNGGVARSDGINQRLAERPEATLRAQIRLSPAPMPLIAFIGPEVQALRTQLIQDKTDMPNEGVTDEGGRVGVALREGGVVHTNYLLRTGTSKQGHCRATMAADRGVSAPLFRPSLRVQHEGYYDNGFVHL